MRDYYVARRLDLHTQLVNHLDPEGRPERDACDMAWKTVGILTFCSTGSTIFGAALVFSDLSHGQDGCENYALNCAALGISCAAFPVSICCTSVLRKCGVKPCVHYTIIATNFVWLITNSVIIGILAPNCA